MSVELKKINKQKVSFFRFKKLNSHYLLTNDVGEYCFLLPQEFDLYLAGNLEKVYPDRYSELQNKGFIRDRLDFDGLARKYASRNSFLYSGPTLHIVVVTLRCDHKCSYCQASSYGIESKRFDMDISTAQKAVDIIFESPNRDIVIEFQGGEPLLNWDTVKFIVKYANKKNKSANKRLIITLVSNLTFMSEAKLTFLMKNNVAICTSLDGPEELHNRNRIATGRNNSYKNTIKWLKVIKSKVNRSKSYKYEPNALTTISKSSLSYPRQIIDEYVNLGLEGIHLRPVNPFGVSKKIWQKINFSTKDFLDFYQEALEYIIELNQKGKNFYERTASIFLQKILTGRDPNFLDIRSPCGAGIGQLAYNFNGDVYSCDEGRMLSMMGDESFRLGNIKKNTYQELIDNDIVKTLCFASCLDGLPACSECVYKSYCGTCPIYNYVVEGNVFSKIPLNKKCSINKSILDYLFERLLNPQIRNIFDRWIENKRQIF